MTHQYIQVINVSEPLVDAQVQYEFNEIEMKTVQLETDEQQKIPFSDVAVGDDVSLIIF